jgi:hypothetical protein
LEFGGVLEGVDFIINFLFRFILKLVLFLLRVLDSWAILETIDFVEFPQLILSENTLDFFSFSHVQVVIEIILQI